MSINIQKLSSLLWDDQNAKNYSEYCYKLQTTTKDWKLVNYFAKDFTEDYFAQLYRLVQNEWLVFDGKHITLWSNGISYDYVAYKNKMLLAYPESKIDLWLVYKWDEFESSKDSWKVIYNHKINNPFDRTDENIIWWYVVIKNERWEFMTTLTKADLEKHKKVAKTAYIWNAWYPEMCMKTLIKKACKVHFNDIYEKIEDQDNEQNDLELVNVEQDWKDQIDSIETIEALREFARSNKGKGKDFDNYLLLHSKKLWSTTASNERLND